MPKRDPLIHYTPFPSLKLLPLPLCTSHAVDPVFSFFELYVQPKEEEEELALSPPLSTAKFLTGKSSGGFFPMSAFTSSSTPRGILCAAGLLLTRNSHSASGWRCVLNADGGGCWPAERVESGVAAASACALWLGQHGEIAEFPPEGAGEGVGEMLIFSWGRPGENARRLPSPFPFAAYTVNVWRVFAPGGGRGPTHTPHFGQMQNSILCKPVLCSCLLYL